MYRQKNYVQQREETASNMFYIVKCAGMLVDLIKHIFRVLIIIE